MAGLHGPRCALLILSQHLRPEQVLRSGEISPSRCNSTRKHSASAAEEAGGGRGRGCQSICMLYCSMSS